MNYPLLNLGTGKRPFWVRPIHIQCLRTLAVLLLFACEFLPLGGRFPAARLPLSGFVLLSGILFTAQRIEVPGRWIAARAVRAGVSFGLSLLLLLLLVWDGVDGLWLEIESYLLSLGCASRLFQLDVPLAELLWLLLSVLLCFLITPLLSRLQDSVNGLSRGKKAALCCALLLVNIGVSLIPFSLAGQLLFSLSVYAVAYFARPVLLSLADRFKTLALLTLTAAGCLLLVNWLSALLMGLPSLFWPSAVVVLTALRAVVYFWFFAVAFFVVRRFRRFPRAVVCFVRLVDSMVFELYLVIYLVRNSRLDLLSLTSFEGVNLLLSLLAAFAAAFCLSRAGRWAGSKVEQRSKLS